MYAIGVVLAMITAIIMRKNNVKGETTPFIMELPPYRVPKAKALLYIYTIRPNTLLKKPLLLFLFLQL